MEADPCRQPLSDAVLKGRIWFYAEEVYHE